jgi:hypothetical protein
VKPGEVESLGRDRTVPVLTPSVVVTDRYQEQNLEGAAGKAGVVWVTAQQANFDNTMKGGSGDESWRLDGGENP